jgi:sugar phosphate isomerase/epimerase
VQHLGGREEMDERRKDAAFSSLEHLAVFAKHRGVTIALENTPGELATPENLRQFITDTKLTDLRMCFDVGHAHIGGGVLPCMETMRERIVTAHVHDNHGEKDEHLAPFDGTIEWKEALHAFREDWPLVMELKEQAVWAEPAPASVALGVVREAFDKLEEARGAA